MKPSKSYLPYISLLAAALMLCFWAFYNRFPLVFPDTGAYIDSGFSGHPPPDRPVFYGLFVRHISLSDSLFLPIVVQGFIMAYLLWLWVLYWGWERYQQLQLWGLVFILTFFTGASVQVSQLMPDVFAAILLLSLGLMALAPNLSKRHTWIVGFLLFLSLITHNSHALIVWGILLALVVLYAIRRWSGALLTMPPFYRWKPLLVIVLAAQLTLPASNWIAGEGFVSSRAAHVFLMTRLVDWGVIDLYLEKTCPEKAYKFCAYRDSIPAANFLWSDQSPLYKTGGWDANKVEYDAIISDVVRTPKFFILLVIKALESTAQQFFCFAIGDTTDKNEAGSIAHIVVKRYYPDLDRAYLWALQQRSELEFTTLNLHHRYLIGGGMAVTVVLLLSGIQLTRFRTLALFLLVALLANAAVCGILSGPFDRYQCRVVYLIILPLYFLFWQLPYIQTLTAKIVDHVRKI